MHQIYFKCLFLLMSFAAASASAETQTLQDCLGQSGKVQDVNLVPGKWAVLNLKDKEAISSSCQGGTEEALQYFCHLGFEGKEYRLWRSKIGGAKDASPASKGSMYKNFETALETMVFDMDDTHCSTPGNYNRHFQAEQDACSALFQKAKGTGLEGWKVVEVALDAGKTKIAGPGNFLVHCAFPVVDPCTVRSLGLEEGAAGQHFMIEMQNGVAVGKFDSQSETALAHFALDGAGLCALGGSGIEFSKDEAAKLEEWKRLYDSGRFSGKAEATH